MSIFSWLFGDEEDASPEPLVFGARLRCGPKVSYLCVGTDVEQEKLNINNLPGACLEDSKELVNILSFGECHMGGLCDDQMDLDEKWTNPEPQHTIVNGKEIITTKSYIICNTNMMRIEAETSGQEGMFAKYFILLQEMEQKYPGLQEILQEPYGSLYLNKGMYENALQFLEDRLKFYGGEIELATIYDKENLENEFIRALFERLIPDCNTTSIYTLNATLEILAGQRGVNQNTKWDSNILNETMLIMLKDYCSEKAEQIETSSFHRWNEKNRRYLDWLGQTATSVQYTTILYGYAVLKAEQMEVQDEIIEDNVGDDFEPGSLNNVEARKWYLEHEAQIPDMIDKSLPLEEQAKQAFNYRNQFRTQARELMADRELAESLYKTDPNLTWEQLIQKQINKGYTGDDIYKAIIESSQRSRKSVNKSLGLE